MQIILKLTTACNLKCVYCSEGDCESKILPKEIFFKLIDELPQLLQQTKNDNVEFLFHGGEPMLYGRDELKILVEYAKKNLPEYRIKFLIQTNGTLIDETWIKFFEDENISIGVSLDGYPEIHDKNRRTKNNEPTAEKILQNLKLMRKSNLNFGTLMVLNSAENIDADNLFAFICENEIQPKIHSVIPCGRAAKRKDFVKIYDTWIELMKKLLIKALQEDKTQIIQPLDETLNAILGIAPMHECSYNGSCGKNFISLYPDGEVGFCGRDNFARFLTYGNLSEKNLLELYNSANAEKIRTRQNYLQAHDCKNCSEWEFCHGGCAFEAVNFFGTLEAKYPTCESRKKFIRWLRGDGLKLLKESLIHEKIKYRKILQNKKQILNELSTWTESEVKNFAET